MELGQASISMLLAYIGGLLPIRSKRRATQQPPKQKSHSNKKTGAGPVFSGSQR
jgi:hypothetical protein